MFQFGFPFNRDLLIFAGAQDLLHLATSSVKDGEEDAQEDLRHGMASTIKNKGKVYGKVIYQNLVGG